MWLVEGEGVGMCFGIEKMDFECVFVYCVGLLDELVEVCLCDGVIVVCIGIGIVIGVGGFVVDCDGEVYCMVIGGGLEYEV